MPGNRGQIMKTAMPDLTPVLSDEYRGQNGSNVCVFQQTSLAFSASNLLYPIGTKTTVKVTEEVVREVAELAQLKLDQDEVDALIAGMTNILDLAEQMQNVDTSDVVPVSNPLDATATMRADDVTEINQREKFQQIAPATEDGLYLVPRVVE